MFSRMSVFATFLLLFASILSHAQTATCTNWKFFQLPSPWTISGLIYTLGINRWGTFVGAATPDHSYKYGLSATAAAASKTFKAPKSSSASSTFFTRRNNSGVTIGYYGTAHFAWTAWSSQAAPRRNKTVTPKADHPWRHNSRKMAVGGTTGMAVSDAISVAVSSTSPLRAQFQTRPR
jgi:hypothetical protein